MLIPIQQNLIIYQGSSFTHTWHITDANDVDIDLTNFIIRMQIRKSYNSKAILDLDNLAKLGIRILHSPKTMIDLYLTPEQTQLIKTNCIYDIELEDTLGDVIRFIQGNITISKEVTK